MSALNPDQIGALIYFNGKWGPGADQTKAVKFLDTAIAIALAESGGDPSVVSPTNDYGLWQINKAAHPDLFASHDWTNPVDNTEMARQVWANAGNSFRPWVTYTLPKTNPRSYLNFTGHGQTVWNDIQSKVKTPNSGFNLGAALAGTGLSLIPGGAALNAIPGLDSLLGAPANAAASVVGSASSGIGGIVANALHDVFKFLVNGFMTIGAALLAIVLLALGIWFIIGSTKAGKSIESKIGDGAKLAAVA